MYLTPPFKISEFIISMTELLDSSNFGKISKHHPCYLSLIVLAIACDYQY